MSNVCQLGVYDGNGTFGTAGTMTYDVYYLAWYPLWTAGAVTALCNASRSKGRTPILRIEPTINPKVTTAWEPGYTNLLDDTSAGGYDYAVLALAAELRAYGGPVILGWGHGMDDLSKAAVRPWVTAPDNGAAFAAAYNRFVNVTKLYTHHLSGGLSFLWSPSGKYFVAPYYIIPLDITKPDNIPTTANVDYIGFDLYEYPEFDLAAYEFVRNFQQMYDALLQRFNFAQKKLIVFMGCGVGSHQTAWTQNALTQLQAYANNPPSYSSSNLVAAVWHNAPTTDTTWGYQLPAPDFSVDPSLWHL